MMNMQGLVSSVKERITQCDQDLLSRAVGKDGHDSAQRDDTVERENQLLMDVIQDHHELLEDCEKEMTRGKSIRGDSETDVAQVIDRLKYETKQLQQSKVDIQTDKKEAARIRRTYVRAMRWENYELREKLAAKMRTESREKVDDDTEVKTKRKTYTREHKPEPNDEEHEVKHTKPTKKKQYPRDHKPEPKDDEHNEVTHHEEVKTKRKTYARDRKPEHKDEEHEVKHTKSTRKRHTREHDDDKEEQDLQEAAHSEDKRPFKRASRAKDAEDGYQKHRSKHSASAEKSVEYETKRSKKTRSHAKSEEEPEHAKPQRLAKAEDDEDRPQAHHTKSKRYGSKRSASGNHGLAEALDAVVKSDEDVHEEEEPAAPRKVC